MLITKKSFYMISNYEEVKRLYKSTVSTLIR